MQYKEDDGQYEEAATIDYRQNREEPGLPTYYTPRMAGGATVGGKRRGTYRGNATKRNMEVKRLIIKVNPRNPKDIRFPLLSPGPEAGTTSYKPI